MIVVRYFVNQSPDLNRIKVKHLIKPITLLRPQKWSIIIMIFNSTLFYHLTPKKLKIENSRFDHNTQTKVNSSSKRVYSSASCSQRTN